ncbi:hypothetical protein [Thiohalophilus thiocyanatoxydans]|uniref:Uncharacterized protein n=1 Tax=Thiohalophilus thiocyanatoxydans TaxID=381308 RepID=A0A4R8IQP7_9GAMM|nr:hypothetical protein [Thiohalophilus thiocyanatoxydans]TDY02634.1 hypothetical protein EDC23_1009 [Thiohalophilus thiocyanatoxydans]
MNYLQQLEKVLETRFKLATMETYDTDRVIDLFNQVNRFSNKAIYIYQAGESMHRVGAAHISLPHTRTPLEVLEHIDTTPHYGIYILRDFNSPLEDKKAVDKLKQIGTSNTRRLVILLSEYIDLPMELKPYTLRAKHRIKQAS